jgi:hydrogenase nickel incorporation protein HypB
MLFNSADVAVATKMDLASAVEFDWQAAYGNFQAVRPGMQLLKLCARSGEGMDDYLNFLQKRLNESRVAANLSTVRPTP